MNRLRLLVVALLLAACGAPQPTVVVPMEIAWDGDFAALIFDSTGLVTGGRYRDGGEGPWPGGAVFVRPERNELEIAWIGGACSHRPTVTLSGTSAALHIEVDNPPDPNFLPFLPIACPAVGLPAGVTLSLREPIAPAAVAFEISR